MAQKDFYDLEYIIEINEKRIEEYISAYQKVVERFTNIIIIYSAIAIFLVPVFQDVFLSETKHWVATACFFIFAGLFSISICFTIGLIMPADVSYLTSPKIYYETYRLQYEASIGSPGGPSSVAEVTKLLQASYIGELQIALDMNISVFTKKSALYYNALVFSLLSAVPFLVCIGYHITQKEDNVQKVEIVNYEKNLNFQYRKLDSVMARNNKISSDTTSSTTTTTTTKLPGINNAQVIPSSPNIIRENSSKIKKR